MEEKEKPEEEKEPKKAKKSRKKEALPSKEMTNEELKKEILSLANKGHSSAEIGTILKEQHNIPSVKAMYGKRISEVLEGEGIKPEVPEDLMNLIREFVNLQKHMQEHKKDYKAKRGYQLAASKIRRLVKYYVSKKRLPEDWIFTPEKAELLVK